MNIWYENGMTERIRATDIFIPLGGLKGHEHFFGNVQKILRLSGKRPEILVHLWLGVTSFGFGIAFLCVKFHLTLSSASSRLTASVAVVARTSLEIFDPKAVESRGNHGEPSKPSGGAVP